MSDRSFLIYGANGFTGQLIAERARERGLSPILAGRSQDAVAPLAARLGLPHRVFSLDSADRVADALHGVSLVLHCAGPYSKTSRPMVDACLAAKAHYLDITGEFEVLSAVLARGDEARRAGVVLLPAVGFDVIPTDCMAARLHQALPDATELALAFSGGMAMSPGTAKTTLENLHVGQKVRRSGSIVSMARPQTMEIPFASGKRFGMSIPWGDLSTAYHSTGIANITVYTVVPKAVAVAAPLTVLAKPLLQRPGVIKFLQDKVGARAPGPTSEQRRSSKMSIWGRVTNAAGRSVEGHLTVPEGYELTVLGSLEAASRVLGGAVAPGSWTPSTAFGAEFVTTLPGVSEFRIEGSP